MEFKKINKIQQGKFITRYDIEYIKTDGKEKTYEMISRNPHMHTLADLNNPEPDSVILILTNQEGKILINKEYRMAMGQWIYNFPAGLIDPGETPQQAAKRELKEETGLDLITIDDILFDSYSAVGFSNEKNIVIVGTAEGTFHESTSTSEEIEAKWYTKKEVRQLLKSQYFAARTQAYCYLWAK
ncbi:MAG: NUDIX hydrolase [Erysipelotrichaceae bacterium]|jgi:ADP-ribose pyrophosphatase|nr:NUDIX hydrolase [Erysipelotrichaceae bacterium]